MSAKPKNGRPRRHAGGKHCHTGAVQRSAVRPSPIFLAIVAITIGGGLLVGFTAKEPFPLTEPGIGVQLGALLFVLGGWGVSLCLHEFGHAIVAYKGGDREVYFKGYLTLDPRRYTDPVFSLVIPLLLLAIGGIPLPGGAVWINHYSLRSKRVESLVSLAGPLTNLVLGVALVLSAGAMAPEFALPLDSSAGMAGVLYYLGLLQILAFVLNILPIPGLDGWGAIEPYLSHEAQRFGAKARPWAPLILFACLIGLEPVRELFFTVSSWVFELVGGHLGFSGLGQELFLFWR
jgi:Zn-dependent protease